MLDRRKFLLAAGAGAAIVSLGRPALAATRLDFIDLYVRDAELSPATFGLTGQEVEMRGFMAPPLKAEASFFVLTSVPMAVCPFCESEAQWPDDIVLVLTNHIIGVVPFNVPIRVVGVLETGFERDPETGFVSLIRIARAAFARL